jgi:hypothetical protein
VYYEKTSRHTMSSTCYNIHLRPAVILKNFLPLDLICCIQGVPTEKKIKAGESIQIPTAEPGNTVIALRVSISSNHTLSNQLHGAEPLLRNCQSLSFSRLSQYFKEISKVHYPVHKSLILVPILSQLNSVLITASYCSKNSFNIICLHNLGLRIGLFPSGFPTKILLLIQGNKLFQNKRF